MASLKFDYCQRFNTSLMFPEDNRLDLDLYNRNVGEYAFPRSIRVLA